MENRFPETLKSLLRQKGTTHAELAKVIGLQTNNISMYIAGKARPNIDSLIKIASYFGVSLDYLITGQSSENKILVDELRLSGEALQTLKELAGKVYGEKNFGLSGELDRLICDPDFLDTLFDATCEYQHDAEFYPLVKDGLEAKGKDASLPLYMDMVEREAAEKLYNYFRRKFRKDNIMRNVYENNSSAMESALNKFKKMLTPFQG